MNLIDIRQVATQILGFLILVWILRRFAWGPLLGMLEARRQKIAGEFREAERLQTDAHALKARYEQEMKGIEAEKRQRLLEGVAEGQKVAAEIRAEAHAEAQRRLERAREEIGREEEKAKEILKEKMIAISMRSAEKILRLKIDEGTQRKLAAEFLDDVGTMR